jgi:hypothetical protein
MNIVVVLIDSLVKNIMFLDVMLYSLIEIYPCFHLEYGVSMFSRTFHTHDNIKKIMHVARHHTVEVCNGIGSKTAHILHVCTRWM